MNLWLVPALLFVPVPQSAHSPDAVVERLAKAGVFAFGPAAYARIISPGEKDYRTVFNRGSALEENKTKKSAWRFSKGSELRTQGVAEFILTSTIPQKP